ncbi:MAG: GntR family transcriptional regulator, partial [Erysipelotrichales bacterium]
MDQDKKLYMYVYRSVLIDIFNDVYMYNTKLPTLPKLCEIYNVGRNTVRSALLKLQEDGYISMQRGARATVVFNHEDENLHKQYIQTLSNLKNSIKDAFETMEYIFPSIGALALKNATDEQINLLLNQVSSFDIDNIENEAQLVKELFEIYEVGFSFLGNPILDDLITTILYSIYLPSYTSKNQKNSKKSIKHIQATLKILIKSKNSFIIKNSIAGLCHSYGKLVVNYIESICEGIEPKENKEFVWTIHHDEDYLYMQVVTQIINDINNKVYVKGDLLPSIAQLALQYNVSERTSRRALEALREYRIIQTINGLGSKIVINAFKNNTRLLKNPKIKHHIQDYYNSSMLVMMINEAIFSKVIKSVSDEEL